MHHNFDVNETRITHADAPESIEVVRVLFQEYAQSLAFSLCFQDFDSELAQLPGKYARPEGRLLLAQPEAGCVGVRPLAMGICEMKRMYVRPALRGHGLGRLLAEAAIREARAAGYTAMRLDTIEHTMNEAVALYRKLGFREIAPYRSNPIAGALYMELCL